MAGQPRVEGEPRYCTLQARIRPGKDDDLAKELGNLPPSFDDSDLIRIALRAYLLGQNQAAASTYQQPISKPDPEVPQRTSPVATIGKLDTEGLDLETKEVNDDDLEANIDKYLDNI
jgi:hypothetical protein